MLEPGNVTAHGKWDFADVIKWSILMGENILDYPSYPNVIKNVPYNVKRKEESQIQRSCNDGSRSPLTKECGNS